MEAGGWPCPPLGREAFFGFGLGGEGVSEIVSALARPRGFGRDGLLARWRARLAGLEACCGSALGAGGNGLLTH